ncbi:MAG: hypothetical protein QOE41_2487 [Mycobacterium sp.]|jgi:hypothetical protein|nr:triacylglycerol lipase [Mycobacterium sp.]MDT5133176.1 hypothetical protein [Mycobacterium sp.]
MKDPLVPWTAVNQLGRDWCVQGVDVEFRTNEQPRFLVVNHALPMSVDGEPAMQWTANPQCSGSPTASTASDPKLRTVSKLRELPTERETPRSTD